MPTRGRREWAGQAVKCFLTQDYENKSLIILDDQDERSFPIGGNWKDVVYVLLPERYNIAKKRNIGCELASAAEFIANFDSDDWSAPTRLSEQVALLQSSGKALCGFDSLIFYDPVAGQAAQWVDGGNCSGTSMVYRRDWWKAHKFPETLKNAWGEDNAFRNMAWEEKQLVLMRGAGLIVARAHAGNTNKKKLTGESFRPFAVESLPVGFPR